MSTTLHYWEALERLKKNSPIRVKKGSSINNDTVALEAGMKRGSIKKSRKSFATLIEAISEEAEKSSVLPLSTRDQLKLEKSKKNNYRELYHQALNRELMLMDRLAKLEQELQYTKKVIPFKL